MPVFLYSYSTIWHLNCIEHLVTQSESKCIEQIQCYEWNENAMWWIQCELSTVTDMSLSIYACCSLQSHNSKSFCFQRFHRSIHGTLKPHHVDCAFISFFLSIVFVHLRASKSAKCKHSIIYIRFLENSISLDSIFRRIYTCKNMDKQQSICFAGSAFILIMVRTIFFHFSNEYPTADCHYCAIGKNIINILKNISTFSSSRF